MILLSNSDEVFTNVLVAIDKFSKWIEYKPVTKISADQAVSFICDILHRFGFPNTQVNSGNSAREVQLR